VTPFAKGSNPAHIAAQIDSFNTINRQIAGDFRVQYLDITAESRKAAADPSLIAGDGLHFSGKEYEIWAAMMAPIMKGVEN
jgi:lysophospholipase L1-like esterase